MSKNVQAVVRFVAVFVALFAAQATVLHAATWKELLAAAVGALPLAIEKYTVSGH